MRKAAFVYDEAFSGYMIREDHVLRPTRLRYTYELLEAFGAFTLPGVKLIAPPLATEEELLTIHTRKYVAAVKSFSQGQVTVNPAHYNFSDFGDNSIFPGMFEASARSVGGSLLAARLVASGEMEVAFNIAGGLHHAAPDHASGFCVFNDPAVAIHDLIARGLKVAYVDIDAHHGDGVQNVFYETPSVLTISLHESGMYLFPGTGEVHEMGRGAGKGYAVNVPLAPYTDDEIYLRCFRAVVPPLLARFQPDIVVTQLGVDGHFLDPLAHLCLTTQGYEGIFQEFRRLCPRWVALGGGGYNIETVFRTWALAFGIMTDHPWPDELPASFQERHGVKKLHDEARPAISPSNRAQAERFALRTLEALRQQVFPLHGL